MNSPTEQHLGAAFRDLVAEQPFTPDVVGHRASRPAGPPARPDHPGRHRCRRRRGRGGGGRRRGQRPSVRARRNGPGQRCAPGDMPARRPVGSTDAQPPLVKLAAYLAAEPQPAGDATLVERETGAPGQASINVWDLYTDDGRYFFSQTEAGLPAQVKEDNNQGDGQFGREVAAATYAVTGDLDTAALKMAWAPDTTPVPAWLSAQVKNMSAGGLQIDNYVWENCEDALVAGSGNPQVRAGVLRLVSALPGITVTHGTADGQPTLTLTAGAAELGSRAATDKANPKAAHGAGLPGGDHHQRRHRHPAGVRRRPGRQGRRHRHLRGDPGQPGRHRRRQVLTCRTDQRSPARPYPGRGSSLTSGTKASGGVRHRLQHCGRPQAGSR